MGLPVNQLSANLYMQYSNRAGMFSQNTKANGAQCNICLALFT